MATNPLFWAAWHSPDSKTARREQRSLLLLMALSFWIHPGHALFLSRCQALLCVQMVTEVTARGLSSPLSPPGSQFYPYLSDMDILPWCQLRMKLEQLALPQLLPRAGLPWDEELSLDILSSYTSSLVPATTSSWSLCRLYMCKIPFPACFGIRACPAQELSPFPCPHPCSGSELAAVAGGTGGALSSHHLLLVFNLTGWGLTPWREREQDPSGEESPACRQGHLPTCTDIFYRHGCTCVDNMVF